jgi:hypothetical protein
LLREINTDRELNTMAAPNMFPARRASNRGFLNRSLLDYLRLLDWTGRRLRQDKRDRIPGRLAPILERLRLEGEAWVDLVSQMPALLRSAAGQPMKLEQHAEQSGRRWVGGVGSARRHFGSQSQRHSPPF